MKKLRLDADDVRVESFPTGDPEAARGTVRAHSGITAPGYCPTSEEQTCNGWPSCPATSDAPGYTCENSCSDWGCTACGAWC